MKNWFWTLLICTVFLSACKDGAAPTYMSFKINGQDIDLNDPSFSAGINQTATFQIIVGDNEELLQLIAYIDTTGLDDRLRLYADGLTGVEAFVEFNLTMFEMDALADQYFFGEPLPLRFTITDNNQNTQTVIIPITTI